MRLIDIPEYWWSIVRVTLVDGSVFEGEYIGSENSYESSNGREGILLDYRDYIEEVNVDEIKTIELV